MSGKYDDIIGLPRHVSAKHRPMSRRDRAAQFAPFAALTGHGAALSETARLTTDMIELSEDAKALLDMKQQVLCEVLTAAHHPEVTVMYFRPDEVKNGGEYVSLTGRIKEIDSVGRVIVMEDGLRIEIDCIADLDSELFSGEF